MSGITSAFSTAHPLDTICAFTRINSLAYTLSPPYTYHAVTSKQLFAPAQCPPSYFLGVSGPARGPLLGLRLLGAPSVSACPGLTVVLSGLGTLRIPLESWFGVASHFCAPRLYGLPLGLGGGPHLRSPALTSVGPFRHLCPLALGFLGCSALPPGWLGGFDRPCRPGSACPCYWAAHSAPSNLLLQGPARGLSHPPPQAVGALTR